MSCVRPAPNATKITLDDYSPSLVKSNSLGKSFPFGILIPSTRSSSKKGWHMASIELKRASGVYSSNFATKSIDSGAVRGRNT